MSTTTDFNVGGITANVNAKNVNFSDGTAQSTAAGTGPNGSQFLAAPSRMLFVDGSRLDSYTPDGTALRPFKTVMAAVNQIITNGDNASHSYVIDIVGPGNYNETVDLGNANIVSLTIQGPGIGFGSAAASINALQSIANNDQQVFLCFKNLSFGTVTMTGASDGTHFGNLDLIFVYCQMSSPVAFTNCNYPGFYTCSIPGAITMTNVSFSFIYASTFESGTLTINTTVGNKPIGFGAGTSVKIQNSEVVSNPITLSGAGTSLLAQFSTIGSSGSTITAPSGTTYTAKASYSQGIFVA